MDPEFEGWSGSRPGVINSANAIFSKDKKALVLQVIKAAEGACGRPQV
jgi:hypothetical protein